MLVTNPMLIAAGLRKINDQVKPPTNPLLLSPCYTFEPPTNSSSVPTNFMWWRFRLTRLVEFRLSLPQVLID